MSKEFRVMDCRTTAAKPAEIRVLANTAEHAARLAIGEDLVRGYRQSGPPRAKVYTQGAGGLTLIRLYARPIEKEGPELKQKSTDRWSG